MGLPNFNTEIIHIKSHNQQGVCCDNNRFCCPGNLICNDDGNGSPPCMLPPIPNPWLRQFYLFEITELRAVELPPS